MATIRIQRSIAAILASTLVGLAAPALAQDTSSAGTARQGAATAAATPSLTSGDLVSPSLAAALAAAVTAGTVRLKCEAGTISSAPSRQAGFPAADGTRQVTVSVVGRAAAPARRDTGAAGAAPGAGTSVPEFSTAELLVIERSTGIAERAEIFPDHSMSVRRTAPGGTEPGSARVSEVTPYQAGDPLAREMTALAARVWALRCP